MAEGKKTSKTSGSDSWAKAEPWVVGLGTWSWAIALAGAVVLFFQGLGAFGVFGVFYRIMYGGPVVGVWNMIQVGGTIVLIFIYVLKPFSVHCKGKDWEALIKDTVGGSFPKMWLMWILLAVFSYWGCAGVAVPALLITFLGPGKGRVFGGKK